MAESLAVLNTVYTARPFPSEVSRVVTGSSEEGLGSPMTLTVSENPLVGRTSLDEEEAIAFALCQLHETPNNIIHNIPGANEGIGNPRFDLKIMRNWEKPLGQILAEGGYDTEGYSALRLFQSGREFFEVSDEVFRRNVPLAEEEVEAFYRDAVMERGNAREQLLKAIEPWYIEMRRLGYEHFADLAGVKVGFGVKIPIQHAAVSLEPILGNL